MKKIVILLIFINFACSKKDDLVLEILNQEIKSIDTNSLEFNNLSNSDSLIASDKSKTIVVYKLTNNSNKTFFFNLNSYKEKFQKDLIKMDRVFVKITQNNQIVKCKLSCPSLGSGQGPNHFEVLNQLDYSFIYNFNNFIIYPKQIIYFEWFIMLPKGNRVEFCTNSVNLDSSKKYFIELLLRSDSLNYKNDVSRTEYQTIKENGYEVYNGIIKSKNKIPIKFVDLPK